MSGFPQLNPYYNDLYVYQRLTVSGSVKVGVGLLGGFIVASGTPTIALYDSLTGSGTLILNTMQTAVGVYYKIPAGFQTGLYAVITGTADITFLYI